MGHPVRNSMVGLIVASCKTVGRMKSHFELNPIPARDAQRAQTKPCPHQDPETPQRLSQVTWKPGKPQWPVLLRLSKAEKVRNESETNRPMM